MITREKKGCQPLYNMYWLSLETMTSLSVSVLKENSELRIPQWYIILQYSTMQPKLHYKLFNLLCTLKFWDFGKTHDLNLLNGALSLLSSMCCLAKLYPWNTQSMTQYWKNNHFASPFSNICVLRKPFDLGVPFKNH